MTRLVMAHYFGGSARSWVPVIDALGAGSTCVAPDLPGFGDTSPPAPPTLDAYADWLIDVAGRDPWIAVGHSMGGKIALLAATRRPPGLTALVLLASAPPGPQPMTEDARRASLAAYGDRDREQHELTGTGSDLPPEVLKVAVDDELRVALPAWQWWLETGSRDDISALTAAIDLPVLVVTGDRDVVMGSDTAPAIARGLRHAELRVIADAGHLLPLERPRAVADLIVGFA